MNPWTTTTKAPSYGVWVLYFHKQPPSDCHIIAGSWRDGRWGMSGRLPPGDHYLVLGERTHWLALPPPPPEAIYLTKDCPHDR